MRIGSYQQCGCGRAKMGAEEETFKGKMLADSVTVTQCVSFWKQLDSRNERS